MTNGLNFGPRMFIELEELIYRARRSENQLVRNDKIRTVSSTIQMRKSRKIVTVYKNDRK